MSKVSLRLLTCSALDTRTARMFDEAIKRRRRASIIRRRRTKIAEDTAFSRAPHHQRPQLRHELSNERHFNLKSLIGSEANPCKAKPNLEAVWRSKKSILSRKSGDYSDSRRAVDVINEAELATMLPAETKKLGTLLKHSLLTSVRTR